MNFELWQSCPVYLLRTLTTTPLPSHHGPLPKPTTVFNKITTTMISRASVYTRLIVFVTRIVKSRKGVLFFVKDIVVLLPADRTQCVLSVTN